MSDILCHREQRYVGAQLTFHYDRRQIILEQTEVTKRLVGRYVEIYHYFDKPLEVRFPIVSSTMIGSLAGGCRREQAPAACSICGQG